MSSTYLVEGWLDRQTDWEGGYTEFTYDPDGRLLTETRDTGIVTSYAYDAAGRLDTIAAVDGATLLAGYDYALDANGNRTAVVTTGSAIANGTESHVYDELDRMVRITYPDAVVVDYAYDAAGNRISQDDGTTMVAFGYDDADQLVTIDGVTRSTYDANGNRLTAWGDSFSYDWRDNLLSATVNGTTTTYASNGDDLRVSRTRGSTTTDYLWEQTGGRPRLLDDGGTGVLHGPAGPVAELAGGNTTASLRDGLGSVRLRTDAANAAVGTADWDAWGNLRASSGALGTLGWTGELKDADTNLVYLRARDDAAGDGAVRAAGRRDPERARHAGAQRLPGPPTATPRR